MSDILTMLWKEFEGRTLPGWVEVANTSFDRDRHYGNLSPITTRSSVGGPHANCNTSFALDPFLCDYQFHW